MPRCEQNGILILNVFPLTHKETYACLCLQYRTEWTAFVLYRCIGGINGSRGKLRSEVYRREQNNFVHTLLSVWRISFKMEYLRLLRKHIFSQDTLSRVFNGPLRLYFHFIIAPFQRVPVGLYIPSRAGFAGNRVGWQWRRLAVCGEVSVTSRRIDPPL